MSGLRNFVDQRQPIQPDPRRQAVGNQAKVYVPVSRLGSVRSRPSTPQPSHAGRPYGNEVREAQQPEAQNFQASNGQGDPFDTDAEGIEDTTVTSIGNSDSNHVQPSDQDSNRVPSGQQSGASIGFANRLNKPFADGLGQRSGRQKLDQLEGEDLTMNDDSASSQGNGEGEVEGSDEGSGEEIQDYGSTEEDGLQEYHDPAGYLEYQQIDYQQIAESPTMKNIRSVGMAPPSPKVPSFKQMNNPMEWARRLGIGPKNADQYNSQSLPKQGQAVHFQTDQGRFNESQVAPSRRTVIQTQRDGEQGSIAPPPTSSKLAAPQQELVEEHQGTQPSSAKEFQRASLPVHTKKVDVRTNRDKSKQSAMFSTKPQQDLVPPPEHRKISPAPENLENRDAKHSQQDAGEIGMEPMDDQLADLDYDKDFALQDRRANDSGSTVSSEGGQTRKRARDLDYSPDQLSAMTFEQLSNEPFNHDPKGVETTLPEEVASSTLTEKLDYMLQLEHSDSKDSQRRELLSSLPIEQYKECGDLIVGKFGNIITKFSDARQRRREITMRFEAEVAERDTRVRSKMGAVEKDLGRLKRRGENAVSGKVDE
ncbi:hypothetical protein P7C71_g5866, partial [Lecanoromycetidae sp. Uapishka_2]